MEGDEILNIKVDDPLYEEAVVLFHLKEQGIKSNKKFIKYLARYAQENKGNEMLEDICVRISKANDPLKFLDVCYKEIHDYLILVNQYLESDDVHGIIAMNKHVYPITLDVRQNWLKDQWTYEDEMEIKRNAIANWMDVNKTGFFKGNVTLFKKYGFSGHVDYLCMKGVRNTEGLKKVPGTRNQYYDPKKFPHLEQQA